MSENSETELILSNADGAMFNTFSAIRNNSTGLGTSRDKSLDLEINANYYQLTLQDRLSLVRSSQIARKAVMLYPLDATRGWCTFNFADNDNIDLGSYFNDLKRGSLRTAFKEASIEANWHGDGYILLGIDDGQELDQPVNENNIKSFDWVEVLFHDEVSPDYGVNYRKPEHYIITLFNQNNLEQVDPKYKDIYRVHKSRILHFRGNNLFSYERYTGGRSDSVLQTMLNSYMAYIQGLMSASSMLTDYSVFRYKLKGLASLIASGKEDLILERFLTIQMGMSVMKGLVMDADQEDGDFTNRSYSGIDKILEMLLEQLVASSNVPRFKLLGNNSKQGMGVEGRGEQERYEWSTLVENWQYDNWLEALRYVSKIALLSKSGPSKGIFPKSFEIVFNNILKLTPLEESELRLNLAKEDEINIAIGKYTPYEARLRYAKPILDSEILLDSDISEIIKTKSIETLTTTPVNKQVVESKTENTDSALDIDGKLLTNAEYENEANISQTDILNLLNQLV